MRSYILFIRIFSVLTTAILLVGLSFGQGKGHDGGKNKGERGNHGGSRGQEKHRDRNSDGDRGERRGGGNPWGDQGKFKEKRSTEMNAKIIRDTLRSLNDARLNNGNISSVM